MSDAVVRVKESRLDWLTLTFKEGAKWQPARIRAQHLVENEEQDGEDRATFSWQGYSGESCGRVRYGVRDDGALLQLSGALADDHFVHLQPLATNVPRIDLAVTVELPENHPNPVTEGYASGPFAPPGRGKPIDYQIIRHSRKGDTLYVGARTSQRYGRIYNKWNESQLDWYRGCYRYELEAKGRLGSRLAAALAGVADRGSATRAIVHDYFTGRGCPAPWTKVGGDLPVASYRPRTADLSRLLWLARQVKPVVDGLRARGRGADVDAALSTDMFAVRTWGLDDGGSTALEHYD